MVGQICLLSCEKALPPFWEKRLTRAIIMALRPKKADTAREMWELKSSLDWLRSLSFSLFLMASKDSGFSKTYPLESYLWNGLALNNWVRVFQNSIFRTLTEHPATASLLKTSYFLSIRRVVLSAQPLLWLALLQESHCLVRVSNSSFSCKQQALGRK